MRGALVPLAPLLYKLAQCDREVARGAFESIRARTQLVYASGRLPCGDGRERVGDLRVQTFGGRMHFLLGTRQTLRGGR
jgi:hypothetical protein